MARPDRPVGRAGIPTATGGWPTCRTTRWSRPAGTGRYDADHEVYLDDVDSLLARIAYYDREFPGGADTTWCARLVPAVSEDPIRLPL